MPQICLDSPKCMGACKCMGASKHIGGVKTYFGYPNIWGFQTYGRVLSHGGVQTYRRHTNIWGRPNIWGVFLHAFLSREAGFATSFYLFECPKYSGKVSNNAECLRFALHNFITIHNSPDLDTVTKIGRKHRLL